MALGELLENLEEQQQRVCQSLKFRIKDFTEIAGNGAK